MSQDSVSVSAVAVVVFSLSLFTVYLIYCLTQKMLWLQYDLWSSNRSMYTNERPTDHHTSFPIRWDHHNQQADMVSIRRAFRLCVILSKGQNRLITMSLCPYGVLRLLPGISCLKQKLYGCFLLERYMEILHKQLREGGGEYRPHWDSAGCVFECRC